MSETAQVITALATLIASVGALITAVFAVVIGWRNSRTLAVVHTATNGMSHELNMLTAKSSKAEGVLEEKERHNAS